MNSESNELISCKVCNKKFVPSRRVLHAANSCCSIRCFASGGLDPVVLKPTIETVKLLAPADLHAKKTFRHKKKRSFGSHKKYRQEAFFYSREWLELRYAALHEYGATCMRCQTTKGPMQVDHIKPRSKFPELALNFANLQVLCRNCNFGKGNRLYGEEPNEKPYTEVVSGSELDVRQIRLQWGEVLIRKIR